MRAPPLRPVLLLDAAASGGLGLLAAAAAGALAAPLGLPSGLLRGAGLALLPWAGLVLWLGLRTVPPRGAVWAVIAVNLLWAAASVLVVAFAPAITGIGVAAVLAQALAVAVLAELQMLGLGRRGAAVTAG